MGRATDPAGPMHSTDWRGRAARQHAKRGRPGEGPARWRACLRVAFRAARAIGGRRQVVRGCFNSLRYGFDPTQT